MSTASTCASRPLRATGLPCPNSEAGEEIRRGLQVGLRHGSRAAIALVTGKGRRRLHDEIGGDIALTTDALIHGLPHLEDPAPLKAALRKARLFYSPAPASARLLPSLVPAAAEMFTLTGRLAEEAALAERDGVITTDEAEAISRDCAEARAVLDSIEVSADVAAGRRLA